MKIINNTDTDLVITGRNPISSAISSKKVFAGTSAHLDQMFEPVVITCCYGHVDIDNFHLCPHEELGTTHNFDFESEESVVTVFHVKTADKCSDNWVEQRDKTLHDKAIRDASNHLPSAHITAFKRIDELTSAIKKSIQICVPNETTSDVKLIRNWAKEIMMQCNIIDFIDED